MENTAPETKIPTAASSDQKKRSLPYPNGWVSSAGFRAQPQRDEQEDLVGGVGDGVRRPRPASRWSPPISPAAILATAMPRLAASATKNRPGALLICSRGEVCTPAGVWTQSGRVAPGGHGPAPPARAHRDDRAGAGRVDAGRAARRARPGAGGGGGGAAGAVPLAAVVSSPLERCRQTAGAVAAGPRRSRCRPTTGWARPATATGPAGRSRSWSRSRCGRSCSSTRRPRCSPARRGRGWRRPRPARWPPSASGTRKLGGRTPSGWPAATAT